MVSDSAIESSTFLHCCMALADIDECHSVAECNKFAKCINTIGSFTCTCNDGFTGNGILCGNTFNIYIYNVKS